MHTKYLITVCLFFSITTQAQPSFLTAGKIEYEKRFNQHLQLDDYQNEQSGGESIWITEQKKRTPKVVNDSYTLLFNEQKSMYKLTKENTENKYLWGAKPPENDIIIQDIANRKISAQREVFENTYLINDSLKNFNWKITAETRTIAGFECKKAITKICDSVYVVAFYTDQILASVGPESFNGLPGLILGIAIPRLHTTWFATKVELIEPSPEQLNSKLKGKAATWTSLHKDLGKAVKDWGVSGARYSWLFSL